MKLVIPGNVPSQKNNKEIAVNPRTGKRFVRSNDRVKRWQRMAILELQKQFASCRVTGYPISVTLIFFFDNARRHDLDNAAAGVMDALRAAQVLQDDSVEYVETLTLQYGGLDKTNPRAEIYLDD